MGTQMSSARRGIATDEMKQVAKDEDVTLDWLLPKIASGSIIIPSNNVRPQKIHNVGIGKVPMTLIFGKNPDDVIRKVSKLRPYH